MRPKRGRSLLLRGGGGFGGWGSPELTEAVENKLSVCLQLQKSSLEAGGTVLWWKQTHIPAGRRTPEPGRVEVKEVGGGRAHQPEA